MIKSSCPFCNIQLITYQVYNGAPNIADMIYNGSCKGCPRGFRAVVGLESESDSNFYTVGRFGVFQTRINRLSNLTTKISYMIYETNDILMIMEYLIKGEKPNLFAEALFIESRFRFFKTEEEIMNLAILA